MLAMFSNARHRVGLWDTAIPVEMRPLEPVDDTSAGEKGTRRLSAYGQLATETGSPMIFVPTVVRAPGGGYVGV